MEYYQHVVLQEMLARRKLMLWDAIVKQYEVSHELNTKVHTWIREGLFEAQVSKNRYRRES
jgi:hypothetical protein